MFVNAITAIKEVFFSKFNISLPIIGDLTFMQNNITNLCQTET